MTTRKLLSLVFVREASKILLGYKKRGFGQGWWNGFGGKVEKGETIMQGALRGRMTGVIGRRERPQCKVLLGENDRCYGGKVEKGEIIMQGALRELREESGLIGDSLEEIGLLTFEFEGDPVLLEVHVFSTTKFSGKPEETEEMKPAWFDIQDIPFKQMWSDDVLWFPLMLKGSKFNGYFLFKGLHDILKYKLDEVDKIEY